MGTVYPTRRGRHPAAGALADREGRAAHHPGGQDPAGADAAGGGPGRQAAAGR